MFMDVNRYRGFLSININLQVIYVSNKNFFSEERGKSNQ